MLAPVTPAEQVALFHDGHPAGMINRGSGGPEAMEFMRWTPMALPYVLLERPRVLILGAGGGGDVGHALLEQASQVDAVEPHRELSDFVRGPFNTFSGGIYGRDTVHLHHNDVRGFLAAAQDTLRSHPDFAVRHGHSAGSRRPGPGRAVPVHRGGHPPCPVAVNGPGNPGGNPDA